MKIKSVICLSLATVLFAGCMSEHEESEHREKKEAKQEKLMAMAKVSKEDAEKTALSRVPGGTVKESELEKEHGKLQWSFDVTQADGKGVLEVNIDAITGEVISVGKD